MIDRYTKVCLTVIALSLAVIGFRGLSPTDAVASNGVQKVTICDQYGKLCATTLHLNGITRLATKSLQY